MLVIQLTIWGELPQTHATCRVLRRAVERGWQRKHAGGPALLSTHQACHIGTLGQFA